MSGPGEGSPKGSFKHCLADFSQSTSMHGAARIGDPSKHVIIRVFWFVLVLSATGYSSYNVSQIILTYLDRPVSTIVSVEYEDNIKFPAVTICNLNQLRLSAINNSSRVREIYNSFQAANTTTVTVGNDTAWDLTGENEVTSSLRPILDELSGEERQRLGHQMETMLLDCSYQQEVNCVESYFARIWNNKFGNCYTFNKNTQLWKVSKAGPSHGLSLLLNVESPEYHVFSEVVGFKITVHPVDAMPFPEDEGIIVSPGFATAVSIRKVDITRTPAPYGNCYDYTSEENLKINMYAANYDVSYTDKACQRSCFQRTIVELCTCCDLDFPCFFTTGALNNQPVEYCNVSNPDDVACAKSTREMLKNGFFDCSSGCLPACSESLYEVEVSMGVWPSNRSMDRLMTNFGKMPSSKWGNSTVTEQYIRDNVAKIDIFFKQLNYEQLTTTPAYDGSRLLSDLGGQLGLWLGFSLLTAVEILGLGVDLIRHLFYKCFRRDKIQSTPVKPLQPPGEKYFN